MTIPKALLYCGSGAMVGRIFPVGHEITIGSSSESMVCLSGDVEAHARIFWDEARACFVLENRGSNHMLSVDGKSVPGEQILRPPSAISFAGEIDFLFSVENQAPDVQPSWVRRGSGSQAFRATDRPAGLHQWKKVRLEFRGEGGSIDRVDLLPGANRVGRGEESDIVIDDPSVSRSHATIRISADTITIQDGGSKNGTRVNQEKISSRTEQEIQPDATISFGLVTAKLVCDR